ncbi:MAG: DNRLRE domain-containing protein, partial [Lutispora sp.]|nr:DNRLRE domain-containing protein [Lutispora sp.]
MAEVNRQKPEPMNVLPKPQNTRVELKKHKTAFSNTYLNPNGSFTIEVSNRPVNYKNRARNWRRIENEIVPSDTAPYEYQNKANAFKVRFGKNKESRPIMNINFMKNRWINVSPAEGEVQSEASNKSTVTYSDINRGIEYKYTIAGDTIKEEIILSRYPDKNTFPFNIESNGISFEKDEEGNIAAKDKNTGNVLFYFNKPFAQDAKGVTLLSTNMNLTDSQLILTINDNWLKNAAYPVIIDPTIAITITVPDISGAEDTYISSQNPDTNYYKSNYLHAGNLSGYGTLRSLVKFKYLPSLPAGAKITKAYLKLFMYLGSTGGTSINLYRLTSQWNEADTKWSNAPTYQSDAILTSFSSAPNSLWSMDITSLVQSWYLGQNPNYGIMVTAAYESNPKLSFFSSNAVGSPNPSITIDYEVDALGTETNMGFHGNVNVHNGNLVLSATDVTLPGRGISITVSRTYNLRSEESKLIGYRWRLNLEMNINYASDEGIIRFTDSDGTIIYFTKSADGKYKASPGIYLTLYKEGGQFVIKEKSGVKYYFTASGKLDKIVDTNNNTTDILYNTDGNIGWVVDPSGREIIFNYSAGKISNITGADIPTVEYTYENNMLKNMKKKNASGTVLDEITYSYDIWNNLVNILDDLMHTTTLEYSYTTDLERRVSKVKKQLTIDGLTKDLETSYTYQRTTDGIITTVTDPQNNITEYMTNNMGNVVKLTQGKGTKNIITQFDWDEENNLVQVIAPKGSIAGNEGKYKTVIHHTGKGNIDTITNPAGSKLLLNYENMLDPDNIIDQAARPNKITYDPANRNVLASSDPLYSTSVYDYDSYGNIISQTNPIGMGGNMLSNSGFEIWDGGLPAYWTKETTLGTISKDASYKANGEASLKISSPGGGSVIIKSALIPITESFKYNVSWYIKTESIGSTYGGADVDIHWFNSSQQQILVNTRLSATIGTTGGFIRKGARVNAPIGAAYASVYIVLYDAGTAWYDNMQFEIGSVINQYNLLGNPGFEVDNDEDDIPDGWTQNASIEARDGLDANYSHSGNRSYLMYGNANNKLLYQQIDISGDAGVPIHFSGWSRSEGATFGRGYYELNLQFNYEDKTYDWITAPFTNNNLTWVYAENVGVSKKKFTSVTLFLKVENQTGQMWFDDVSLRLAGAPNAVMSDYNIAENGNFKYNREGGIMPDSWMSFKSTVPGTYDIAYISGTGADGAFSGSKMIRISNIPDWATVANKVIETIKPNMEYTISAVIKTKDVTGSGAVAKFDILDSSGVYLGQKLSKPLTGTKDWTRVTVSISEAEAKAIAPAAAKLRIAIGVVSQTSGTMYFDAVRMFEGNVETKYVYDANGNYITSITDQLKNTTTYANDSRGNITEIKDPKNNIYTSVYDDMDRIIRFDNPRGLKTRFYYDKNGNMWQIDNYNSIDQFMNTTMSVQYNELDLPKKISDSHWRETTLEYNLGGNLKDVSYPNGKGVHFVYDEINRVSEINYTNDTTKWNFTYDENSNIKTITKNNMQTTSYDYDNLDRVVKVTHPPVNYVSNTMEYVYNLVGQILNVKNSILPTADQLTRFEYDQAGNNVDIIAPNSTAASFMYDEQWRLKKSYVAGTGMYFVSYRDYNQEDRLIRLRTENSSGAVVADYSYEYDVNGNRSKEINNLIGKRTEYVYDQLNQLLEESYYDTLQSQTPSRKYTYQYDLMGNILQKAVQGGATATYAYNNANELTHRNGAAVYSYDYNGNLIGSSPWVMTYNAQNQLITVNDGTNDIASYEYNGEGLRIRKVTQAKIERYYYIGGRLTYITNDANTLKYYFTRDTRGKLLHMIDYTAATPKTYWYIHDAHDNVIGLADSSGYRVINYEYDAWGNVLNATGTVTLGNGLLLANENPFRYCGYQFDTETGWYYLKSRYYAPSIARFLTRDVMLNLNRYSYAANNPVTNFDPDGFRVMMMDDGGSSRIEIQVSTFNEILSTAFNKGVLGFSAKAGKDALLGYSDTIIVDNYIKNLKDWKIVKEIVPLTRTKFVGAPIGPELLSFPPIKSVKFIKGAAKYAGPIAVTVFGVDVIKDFIKYQGTEQWIAAG